MIVRPGSFATGALASLFFIYIWKQYFSTHSLGVLSPDGLSGVVTNDDGSNHELSGSSPYSVEVVVANSTFGFQKVLAIGLPERTDRRDTLRLMSKFQNVDLGWIDAIRGDQMSRKAWPPRWHLGKNQNQNLSLPELGCWRSHSDALLEVIEEGYASALIIEDDVDWDIEIREQLNQFAEASRKLDNDLRNSTDQLTLDTPTISPYGDRWDLLWLGTCAVPDVSGNKRCKSFVSQYDQTHFVYPVGAGAACTYAYAVTQTTALALLGFMQDADKPVDFLIGDFCSSGKECRIIWPQLISSRTIGKESDIRTIDKPSTDSGTWKIKNSAVLEMQAQIRPHKGQTA